MQCLNLHINIKKARKHGLRTHLLHDVRSEEAVLGLAWYLHVLQHALVQASQKLLDQLHACEKK